MKNKRITLIKRPRSSGIAHDELTSVQNDCPDLAAGQVRVRVIYLSIDPTIKLWLNEKPPVVAPISLGDVVPSMGIGIVEASRDDLLPEGTLVRGMLGWQLYSICAGNTLQAITQIKGLPLTAHLSVLGGTGLTAYFGLLDLAKPKPGDTLLVSGAAGAVGSLAGQIGKILGCRVIGIAGSIKKCQYLTDELKFDKAFNYRDEQLTTQLSSLGGIDIFFDNVGGPIREAGILAMADGGRIIICGEIASSYQDNCGTGITHSFQIISKALQLLGLRVDRYFSRSGEAIGRLTQWTLKGQLQDRINVIDGLENAPEALNALFNSSNPGKTIIQVSPPTEH